MMNPKAPKNIRYPMSNNFASVMFMQKSLSFDDMGQKCQKWPNSDMYVAYVCDHIILHATLHTPATTQYKPN